MNKQVAMDKSPTVSEARGGSHSVLQPVLPPCYLREDGDWRRRFVSHSTGLLFLSVRTQPYLFVYLSGTERIALENGGTHCAAQLQGSWSRFCGE